MDEKICENERLAMIALQKLRDITPVKPIRYLGCSHEAHLAAWNGKYNEPSDQDKK